MAIRWESARVQGVLGFALTIAVDLIDQFYCLRLPQADVNGMELGIIQTAYGITAGWALYGAFDAKRSSKQGVSE